MTASLEILTDSKQGVLMVPLSAVASRALKQEDDSKKKAPVANDDEKTEAERRREESSGEKAEVVFVYRGEKVEMRKVKTGIADFEHVEIREGLKMDDKIVSGPFTAITKTLQSGDEVRLREKGKKKEKTENIE
jgi:HlyD family secretion protein